MFWSLENRESVKNIRRVHKRLSNIRKKIMSSLDRSNIDVSIKTIIILINNIYYKFNNYISILKE
jgi:hypothetical protein